VGQREQLQRKRIFARDRFAHDVATALEAVEHAEELAAAAVQLRGEVGQRLRNGDRGEGLKDIEALLQRWHGVVRSLLHFQLAAFC